MIYFKVTDNTNVRMMATTVFLGIKLSYNPTEH